MKFQLFSDLHLEMGDSFIPPDSDADVIILAGDINTGLKGLEYAVELIKHLGKDVIYVPGNHEFYRYDIGLLREEMALLAKAHSKLHLLDNDIVKIHGVRFIGSTLWTDYALDGSLDKQKTMDFIGFYLNDHRLIKNGDRRFTPQDALVLHQESKLFLQQKLSEPYEGKTVVVTHHAPSLLCHHPGFDMDEMAAAFITDCDDLLNYADVWCFGHTHANVDMNINECRVVSNQKGYFRERMPHLFRPNLTIDL
ncbi:metallophosphoesterase [Methylophaga nitratireducenticrescens]|uniref:metallophosphoesterase n=1 Tax=Methylophaga nitratireducenticrescens TaxID=754476 RepID=UPI000CDC700F|nr:metallophosphoesterase [Methylophaga nitratireducenticrescens]AUZ84668.1 serine/threonine protein phosphatase [Methylophaga nitratireducenticrescens]